MSYSTDWWGMDVSATWEAVYVEYWGGVEGAFVESAYTITPPVLPQGGAA